MTWGPPSGFALFFFIYSFRLIFSFAFRPSSRHLVCASKSPVETARGLFLCGCQSPPDSWANAPAKVLLSTFSIPWRYVFSTIVWHVGLPFSIDWFMRIHQKIQYVFITHVCHFANELQGYVHEQTDIFNVADAIRYVSIPIRNSWST